VTARVATDLEDAFDECRRELTVYCYRMLGSGFEAEDAVQQTMLNAWRKYDSFEGRSTVRSWLYSIASNVCIDMLRQSQRRAMPMELGPASSPDESLIGSPLPETTWITPLPDSRRACQEVDPAFAAQGRESVRFAFLTALQHLPASQRATLILGEVLQFRAGEVAEMLGTSVAAVNSSIQRARRTLRTLPFEARPTPLEEPDAALLRAYVDAFERYDIDRLVSLLAEDALQTMPPFALWIKGARNIGRWMAEPGPSHCRGSLLLPARANGCAAFGQYRCDPHGGHAPWAIQVLETSGGAVTGLHCFLSLMDGGRLFEAFGLPAHLDGPNG